MIPCWPDPWPTLTSQRLHIWFRSWWIAANNGHKQCWAQTATGRLVCFIRVVWQQGEKVRLVRAQRYLFLWLHLCHLWPIREWFRWWDSEVSHWRTAGLNFGSKPCIICMNYLSRPGALYFTELLFSLRLPLDCCLCNYPCCLNQIETII